MLENFPYKIRHLRLKRGLSQEAFAKLIGVSTQTVYLWEGGRVSPNWGSVQLICSKLGISVNELLGE